MTFLHKIAAGPADKSYGIHVAKIAGLPSALLRRADKILQKLENQAAQVSADTMAADSAASGQLDLFAPDHPVLEKLGQIDLNQVTPMEALMLLSDLQKEL